MLRIFDWILCPAGRALRGLIAALLRITPTANLRFFGFSLFVVFVLL